MNDTIKSTDIFPDTHSNYEIIAWANNQEVLYYRMFGGYQGEWLMVARDDANYYIYKDWYGSCSGCDAYEGTFSYGETITRKDAEEFAEDYPPFLILPIDVAKMAIMDNNLLSLFPANIRTDTYNINYEHEAEQIGLLIRVREKMPISMNHIFSIDNEEVRREMINLIGEDKFIQMINPDIVDKNEKGEQLLSIKYDSDKYKYLYVKDSSTSRKYLLRVPLEMKKVKQALAWTFDLEENQYNPIKET